MEDRGELLVFHALLPCTVVLAFDLDGGNATALGRSARVNTRACFAGAAHGTAKATGARRSSLLCFVCAMGEPAVTWGGSFYLLVLPHWDWQACSVSSWSYAGHMQQLHLL